MRSSEESKVPITVDACGHPRRARCPSLSMHAVITPFAPPSGRRRATFLESRPLDTRTDVAPVEHLLTRATHGKSEAFRRAANYFNYFFRK
jgi:hypothetical protein